MSKDQFFAEYPDDMALITIRCPSFEVDFSLEELYQHIEARIMQSDKVYQIFAERFRQENYAHSDDPLGPADLFEYAKDTTT